MSENEKLGKPPAILSKTDILNLMSVKSPRLTLIHKDGRFVKSQVWNRFQVIVVDGKEVEFVKCNDCHNVITWKSYNTTSLHRHVCSGAANKGTQLVLEQLKRTDAPKSSITQLNKDITIGLAADLRPLSAINGRGFKHIAQELINFGARHGFQKVSSVLQSRITLKSYLPGIVNSKTADMGKKILTAPSYPRYTFTTDMWSDRFRQRYFISLSIHYIDEDFNLNSHMLAVEEFPDMAKTTINIRNMCYQILERYFGMNTTTVMDSSIAVTDGGSNVINIFPTRYPCLCHKLNLVVGWMFNETNPGAAKFPVTNEKKLFVFKTECPVFQGALSGVKNAVTYFKRTGLNAKLEYTLKQDVDTRWNSQLIMLQSYYKSKEEVKKLLLEKGQIDKIAALNDGAVHELISFLEVFNDCTKAWSKEKEPTLHQAVLWVETLKSHIEGKPEDSEEMTKLKAQARVCIAEYLTLDDLYFVALVFHPMYRKLHCLKDSLKRQQIHQRIREMIDGETEHLPEGSSVHQNATGMSAKTNSGAPLAKLPRFQDLQDSSESEKEHENQKHELDRYLEMRLAKTPAENFEILKFWKEQVDLPAMRHISFWLLAIPASQTSDERIFSTTGATLSPRRTDLKGSTLSHLTFIHKNCSI